MRLTLDDIRQLLWDQLDALATDEPREITRVRVRLSLIVSLLERRLGSTELDVVPGGLMENLGRIRREAMARQEIKPARLRVLVEDVLSALAHITRDPGSDDPDHPPTRDGR